MGSLRNLLRSSCSEQLFQEETVDCGRFHGCPFAARSMWQFFLCCQCEFVRWVMIMMIAMMIFLIYGVWARSSQYCCSVAVVHCHLSQISFSYRDSTLWDDSFWVAWVGGNSALHCAHPVHFWFACVTFFSGRFQFFPQRGFDHTLGFPGEGPPWSMASINVGSLSKQKHVLASDCVCVSRKHGSLLHCDVLLNMMLRSMVVLSIAVL